MTSTPALGVGGVDFVTVSTEDLDRAMRFYGEVLELERSGLWQRGDSPAMGAEFETGTLTIAPFHAAAIGREHRAGTSTIALHVDDVHVARAALEAKGVEFQGDTIDSGVCHMAFFADPDGNPLMLHHRYAPKPARD